MPDSRAIVFCVLLAGPLCVPAGLSAEGVEGDAACPRCGVNLWEAVVNKRDDWVKKHLANGANPNVPAETIFGKRYPLFGAVDEGRLSTVRLLVEAGADVDFQERYTDSYGNASLAMSPLMDASYRGHAGVAAYLISKGANVNAQDLQLGRKNTAMDYARQNKRQDTVALLERALRGEVVSAPPEEPVPAASAMDPNDLKRMVAEALRESVPAKPAEAQAPAMDAQQMKRMMTEAVKEATQAKPAPPEASPLKSDVDHPRQRLAERPNDFAVVVGIEKYSDLPEARFAERDAAAVREHLLSMGFPERNVVLLKGEKAGFKGIEKFVETWLPRNVDERSRVFFYFSGHGAPDAATGRAYILPWDGDPDFLENTGYPVKRLYEKLGSLKASEVVVVLDSCFSGAGGRSVLAKGARPLVAKVDAGAAPRGKLTVFAAASGDQITSVLEDQGHGTFTYFFLKGLSGAAKGESGVVTVQGLFDYLKPKVQDSARRQNRDQIPDLQGIREGRELVRFK